MADNSLIAELASRLSGKAIISSDVTADDFLGIELESLVGKILSEYKDSHGVEIIDKKKIADLAYLLNNEKTPVRVEVSKATSFKSLAKETEADFLIQNVAIEKTSASTSYFTSYFRDRFAKLRKFLDENRNINIGVMVNIEKLKQYTDGREICIVGMVYDRILTKNGNIMVTIDDETGSAKVMFMKSAYQGRNQSSDLFNSASAIIQDEVIAVKGKLSGPFIMANSILWPNIPVKQRKFSEQKFGIAFASDVHVGSKLFLEKQFNRLLQWLNGNIESKRELAEKIKYLIIAGDLVDGIGVYPEQDKELAIMDIYKQYSVLFDYLEEIPEYIHVFVLTGNHDAVQRAEPQPQLPREFLGDFKKNNVHLVTSPGYITLHGIRILSYHGTSLDSIIQSVSGCSYLKPESAMIQVLKKRHISPIYGYNPIVPSKKDAMVINSIPDILHMGHVHRNGYGEYHGTQIINSGTWQARTSYQVKLGHLPTPAVLPVYEAQTGILNQVDFNDGMV